MTEHANDERGVRRGWRLTDSAEDDEVPEGFTWTWRPDVQSSALGTESGGSSTGNLTSDRTESERRTDSYREFAELLDPVDAVTRTEISPVSLSHRAPGEPDRDPAEGPASGHSYGADAGESHLAEDVDYYYDEGPALPHGDAAYRSGTYSPQFAADIATFPVSRETNPEVELDTPIAREAQAAIAALSRSSQPVPRPANTRVFVVANQKGGVGKTTTTVNIAASLAQFGANVLVVDLDPQGNASTALGVDHHSEVPSVYDVLIERHEMDEVVCPVPDIDGLYCVPATIDLAGAEIELVSMVARESRLRRALEGYHQKMDYIFIDCPPSLGLLTVNALVAGSEVLIPIQCEYYALEGLGQLLRNIDLVRGHLNPSLHVSTLLLTMYDARTRLAAQVADEVRLHFPNEVLNTAVPRSVRISEAPSYSQTVMTYDPASSGALAYREAAREIAERGAGPTIPGSRDQNGRLVDAAHATTSTTMNEVSR
jgi:chromosome partitioning protein